MSVLYSRETHPYGAKLNVLMGKHVGTALSLQHMDWLIPLARFAQRQGWHCPILYMGKLKGRRPIRCCSNRASWSLPWNESLHLVIPSCRFLQKPRSGLLCSLSAPYVPPEPGDIPAKETVHTLAPVWTSSGNEDVGANIFQRGRETRSSPLEPKVVKMRGTFQKDVF